MVLLEHLSAIKADPHSHFKQMERYCQNKPKLKPQVNEGATSLEVLRAFKLSADGALFLSAGVAAAEGLSSGK